MIKDYFHEELVQSVGDIFPYNVTTIMDERQIREVSGAAHAASYYYYDRLMANMDRVFCIHHDMWPNWNMSNFYHLYQLF
jgi:hypothetical protein